MLCPVLLGALARFQPRLPLLLASLGLAFSLSTLFPTLTTPSQAAPVSPPAPRIGKVGARAVGQGRATPTATALPLRMFPFALPSLDGSPGPTDVSWLNEAPAGKSGFVRARGEDFVDGAGRRLRLWGVNLNFAGAFPPKEQAPLIAARLAKFGFNSVRIHHFEGYGAPSGLWKSVPNSGRILLPRQIDPSQMDRLDFFVAQLIQRGIYINFNLHVGRKSLEGEGVPVPSKMPEKDKGASYFEPALIQQQRDFARDLLGHVNTYTGRAYSNEPGVCAVEVSNEDSLLGLWLDQGIGGLPSDTEARLRSSWNAWLGRKYSEVSLRRAWTELDEPINPRNLLLGAMPFDVVNPNAPDAQMSIASSVLGSNFALATVGGAAGTLNFDRAGGPTVEGFVRPGLLADLRREGSVSWAFQVNRDGLDLAEGHAYTLSFWARSDRARTISVNLWQDRAPHRFGGFTGFAELGPNWKKFSFTFRASNPDPSHSRLSWNLGPRTGQVALGEVELREGGRIAAPSEWSLAAGVPLLEFKTTPVLVARRDFAQFLCEVESQHARSFKQYLRQIGVRVPIWHTQAQFGGWAGLLREDGSDAIDMHAYWKHPDLGSEGWAGASWTVGNASMTAAAGSDPLSAFALARVSGKPFVMSEWNSGQPNDFGAESLLMAAAYAAWQNWAAVWVFDYHSAGPYERDRYEGFFSIDAHPSKMATVPAAALLFRRPQVLGGQGEPGARGDVAEAREGVTLFLPREVLWLEVASSPGPPTAAPFTRTWGQAGAPRALPLRGKAVVRLSGPSAFEVSPAPVPVPTPSIITASSANTNASTGPAGVGGVGVAPTTGITGVNASASAEASPSLAKSAPGAGLRAAQASQAPAPLARRLAAPRVDAQGDAPFAISGLAAWDDASSWKSDTGEMEWSRALARWTLDTPRSKVAVGSWDGATLGLGAWQVEVPRTRSAFGVWALSSLDGAPIERSRRLLMTAAGRAENVGMGWNAARNSVGNSWGSGPVQAEGLYGRVTLACDPAIWTVHALDTRGQRARLVASTYANGVLSFSASPDAATLWYEISAG